MVSLAVSQVFCHKLFTFCNQVGMYKLQLYNGEFFLHFCQNCPMVKFRYPETATKIWKNSSLFLTLLRNFKNSGSFFSNFVALSQYLNFIFLVKKCNIFLGFVICQNLYLNLHTYLAGKIKTWIYINERFWISVVSRRSKQRGTNARRTPEFTFLPSRPHLWVALQFPQRYWAKNGNLVSFFLLLSHNRFNAFVKLHSNYHAPHPILELSCCKKWPKKSPNQETGLENRGRLKVLNDMYHVVPEWAWVTSLIN